MDDASSYHIVAIVTIGILESQPMSVGMLTSQTPNFGAAPASAGVPASPVTSQFASVLQTAQTPITGLANPIPVPVPLPTSQTTTGGLLGGLNDLMGQLLARVIGPPPAPDLTELGSQTQSLQSAFLAQINQLFAQQGINVSQPIVLQANALGGVQVANDHPQQAQINELLNLNPNLQQAFRTISANATTLLTASGSSSTTATGPLVFSMTLSNGQLSTGFVPQLAV